MYSSLDVALLCDGYTVVMNAAQWSSKVSGKNIPAEFVTFLVAYVACADSR